MSNTINGRKKSLFIPIWSSKSSAVGSDTVCRSVLRAWARVLSIISQGTHGIRLWISPLSFILRFLLLYCFFLCFFLSTFSCTGNVNVRVVIPTGDQVEKLLSVVWKRNAELLNLLHVVEKVQSDDDAGDGYCGLIKKKSINNNDVDNVLVSQLLIKATYFLYWFNYLFCDVELCVMCGWWVLVDNDQQYTLSATQWHCVFIIFWSEERACLDQFI